MKIGITANVLVFEKAGVGKYAINIIRHLLEIDTENDYFLYLTFVRHRKERIEALKDNLGRKNLKRVTIRLLPAPAAWIDYLSTLPIDMTRFFKDPIDVWFAPYVSGILKKGFKKSVAMVHDLVFLRYPLHRGRKLSNYYLKRHQIAAQNCQILIAPSKATKKDLIEFLKVPAKKIKVVPEAADEKFKVVDDLKKIERITKKYFDYNGKYILSVGTLEPRKNLGKLVEAYSLLPNDVKREYRLVICGAKGWNNGPFYDMIEDLNLKDRIILPGYIADEDLAYIYNKASVFVYPALYEGFGLPPLEAMAAGVPVISSNSSSLSEVVGKAGILVDPNSEKAIAQAIKKVLSSPKLAEKMRSKGFIQSQKFSWRRAAEETLKILESI